MLGPNITGEMLPVAYNADGSGGYYLGCDTGGAFSPAFDNYDAFASANLNYTSNKKPAGSAFNASRSSSIYGGSNIVQPPSLVFNHIIKY
jgi:hypothetical protein